MIIHRLQRELKRCADLKYSSVAYNTTIAVYGIARPTNLYTALQVRMPSVMYLMYTPSTHSLAPCLKLSGARYSV